MTRELMAGPGGRITPPGSGGPGSGRGGPGSRRGTPGHEQGGSQDDASRRSADAIVAALAGAGTRLVFGVPGGGPNLDVVGAAAAAGMSFILAHGETAAAIMAATCADLTGAPGAVVVTRGPGLASAANGIAHATLDRLTSELAAALERDGPTVIDASIDPATYPAVMDLTRGEAGRRGAASPHPADVPHPAARHQPTGS